MKVREFIEAMGLDPQKILDYDLDRISPPTRRLNEPFFHVRAHGSESYGEGKSMTIEVTQR